MAFQGWNPGEGIQNLAATIAQGYKDRAELERQRALTANTIANTQFDNLQNLHKTEAQFGPVGGTITSINDLRSGPSSLDQAKAAAAVGRQFVPDTNVVIPGGGRVDTYDNSPDDQTSNPQPSGRAPAGFFNGTGPLPYTGGVATAQVAPASAQPPFPGLGGAQQFNTQRSPAADVSPTNPNTYPSGYLKDGSFQTATGDILTPDDVRLVSSKGGRILPNGQILLPPHVANEIEQNKRAQINADTMATRAGLGLGAAPPKTVIARSENTGRGGSRVPVNPVVKTIQDRIKVLDSWLAKPDPVTSFSLMSQYNATSDADLRRKVLLERDAATQQLGAMSGAQGIPKPTTSDPDTVWIDYLSQHPHTQNTPANKAAFLKSISKGK